MKELELVKIKLVLPTAGGALPGEMDVLPEGFETIIPVRIDGLGLVFVSVAALTMIIVVEEDTP